MMFSETPNGYVWLCGYSSLAEVLLKVLMRVMEGCKGDAGCWVFYKITAVKYLTEMGFNSTVANIGFTIVKLT